MTVILVPTSYSIPGYACGRGPLNITTFSFNGVSEYKQPTAPINQTVVEFQLLQRIEYEDVKVTTCMVKVGQRTRNCGMYSHNSDVEKGERIFLVSMDREECETLVKFGQIKYRDLLIVDLAVNMTNRRSLTAAGHLTSNGKCSGTTYIDQNGNYENVVVTAKLEIEFGKYSAIIQMEKDKLITSSGVHCVYSAEHCTDTKGEAVFRKTPAYPMQLAFGSGDNYMRSEAKVKNYFYSLGA